MTQDAGAVRAGGAFVEILADDTSLQAGLARAQLRFGAAVKALQRLGTGLAIAGAGMALPIVAATRAAASFQDTMLELQAATNDITPRQLAAVRAEALRLSRELGVAPEEVGSAFAMLIKAGMDAETALGGAAKSAVQFAKISGVQMETAATLMKVSMDIYKVSAREAVDTLSAAADSSATSIAQIVEGYSQIASAGRTFDQSLFSIAQGMAVLSNAKIDGEEAGTAIKTFLLRLIAPSKEAEARLSAIGLTMAKFRDADGNLLELAQLADVWRDAIKGIPKDQWQRVLADFFGDRAVKSISTFIEVGKKGFDDIAQAMEESRSVGDKFRIMWSGLTGAMTRMLSALKRIGVAFGESLTVPLWAASHALAAISSALEALFRYVPVLGPAVAAMAGGFFAVGTALAVFGYAADFAMDGFRMLLDHWKHAPAAIAKLTAALRGFYVSATALPLIGPAIASIGNAAVFSAVKVRALAAAVYAIPGIGWIAGIAAALAALGVIAWRYFGSNSPMKGEQAKTRRPDARVGGWAGDNGDLAGGAANGSDTAATLAGAIASNLGVSGSGAKNVQERIAAAVEKIAGNTDGLRGNRVPNGPSDVLRQLIPDDLFGDPRLDAGPAASGMGLPGTNVIGQEFWKQSKRVRADIMGEPWPQDSAKIDGAKLGTNLAAAEAAIRSSPSSLASADRELLSASERAANSSEDMVALLRQIHRAIVRGEGLQFV